VEHLRRPRRVSVARKGGISAREIIWTYVKDEGDILRIACDDRIARKPGECAPAAGGDELFNRLAIVVTLDVARRPKVDRHKLAEESRERVRL
jgi:hypothetical protein